MTTTTAGVLEELDSSSGVLSFARSSRREADRAEAKVLAAAVTWAEQHPPESIHHAATWITAGGDTGLLLAGPGAPLVAEFCIAELALAVGLSTDAGRTLIAHAVELKHRLPRVWARVMTGDLQTWRARRVAEHTLLLSPEAVGFVDAQVAGFAHKIGYAALERLVEEAVIRSMPEKATVDAVQAADGRHVGFHHDQVSFNGTTRIEGELDLADALDLDTALTQTAEQLRLCGSEKSLDVRRAIAAGEIARHQLALHLTTGSGTGAEQAPRPGQDKTVKARQVVLHVHLSHAAITGTGDDLHPGRVENTRTGVTADQIRTWCANTDTQITVKPVIDLADHIATNAYEVPTRLEDQTRLINHTCVFPWCNRLARRCDNEHCVPYDQGGTTCSCNIAPLCRRHHRLKTHTTWIYTVLEPGTFLWTSPHGYQFLRDHTGTLDVSADKRPRNLHPPDA